MTQLLENVLAKIAGLPEDKQNSLASFILAELESEARWDSLFASSQDKLATMAQDALAEFDRGETDLLDLDRDLPKN
jgi:hypothetical protein